MNEIFELYEKQGINKKLLQDIETFRIKYPAGEEDKMRIIKPEVGFYGKEVFEMAAVALLQGENILLSGSKATGKNVLADNLAWIFGRPAYNISFHINTDSSALVGTDTFRNNEVVLRTGPVYDCAVKGGFGILDEINMAKNDAVSVLHATLDYRRMLDVPGYEKIELHDATRFIGTMNYGYAGTKELNEALVSRFMVIDMPEADEETILTVLEANFPDGKREGLKQMAGLFLDLQLKASYNEISTRSMDFRGLIGAIKSVRAGLPVRQALKMGIVNKTFDVFEREIIQDIVDTRFADDWDPKELF